MRIILFFIILMTMPVGCRPINPSSESQLLIFPGDQASEAQRGYTASLLLDHDGLCSGVLLCEQLTSTGGWVLTAGHCVKDEMGQDTPIRELGIGARQILCHPSAMARPYDRNPSSILAGWFQRENDLALVPFGDCEAEIDSSKICVQLPAQNEVLKIGPEGVRVDIAGYGRKSSSRAAGSLSALRQGTLDLLDSRSRKIFRFSNQNSICGGDSGGPMVVTTDGVHMLLGITNRGTCDQRFDSILQEIELGAEERRQIARLRTDLPELAPVDKKYWASFTDLRYYSAWTRAVIQSSPTR
jgi:hypothetical protein